MHGTPLGSPTWQIDDQSITDLGLGVAVERYHTAGSSRDTTANLATSQQRVSHRNDVTGQRNHALHTGLERNGAVLIVAQDCPLTTALGFGRSGATDGAQLGRPVAIPTLQIQISEWDDVGVVVVRRVVVAHQRPGVAGFRRGAAIGELAVDDVGPGEDVVEVLRARHIGLHHHLALSPIAHATVNAGDIAQQRPGARLALKVHITQKAWLYVAQAVRHQLIAVLRNPVQLPLVDHERLDALAETKTVFGADAVGDPGWVVRPRLLHGAVPSTGIGPGDRVVIARHLPLARAAAHGDGWNVGELLSVELDVEQRGVRVA
ncbi:hypothetical protein D3C84_587930 [compost metagenome]